MQPLWLSLCRSGEPVSSLPAVLDPAWWHCPQERCRTRGAEMVTGTEQAQTTPAVCCEAKGWQLGKGLRAEHEDLDPLPGLYGPAPPSPCRACGQSTQCPSLCGAHSGTGLPASRWKAGGPRPPLAPPPRSSVTCGGSRPAAASRWRPTAAEGGVGRRGAGRLGLELYCSRGCRGCAPCPPSSAQ